MRYGYWLPVFGGWLRNVADENMSATWEYNSRLARRSEEIGFDLTLIAELNPIYLTSTSVSIDSLCIMASGFIIPPFFGWLMERGGVHEMVNGVTVYTAQDFNHAMVIMPVSFIVALIISFFMRETFCRSQA